MSTARWNTIHQVRLPPRLTEQHKSRNCLESPPQEVMIKLSKASCNTPRDYLLKIPSLGLNNSLEHKTSEVKGCQQHGEILFSLVSSPKGIIFTQNWVKWRAQITTHPQVRYDLRIINPVSHANLRTLWCKSAKVDMRIRPINRCQQHDEILIALYLH